MRRWPKFNFSGIDPWSIAIGLTVPVGVPASRVAIIFSSNDSPTVSFYGVTPARATFEVSALPKGAKVEVEAVIALD